MLKGRKSVLDEREMLEMYRVEHFGLWLMYGLLCAAVVAQMLLGAPLMQLAGELSVLLLVSVGMIIAYARKGIWDAHSRPGRKGNAAYSAACAAGVALRDCVAMLAPMVGCSMCSPGR